MNCVIKNDSVTPGGRS